MKKNKTRMNEILHDKISWQVVYDWYVIPPCDPSSSLPYCHIQCPYFYKCYPKEDLHN